MGNKFYYIDAVTISVAKRICAFFFEDNFDRIEKNDKERTYDVFLIKPKEKKVLEYIEEDILYFKDFWGNGYRFFYSENK